ncbi:hypothetical protein AB0878_21030 [Amycolatopsis sp. NPDC047767]|uniref:hypothetical protein n=1 Tax=Amycolatopsis sp. NPDC047767 TaxID=3156765 RepID=UPI003456A16C
MAQQAPAPGSWLAGLDFNISDAFGAAAAAGAAVGGGAGAGGAVASSGQGFTLNHDEAMTMLNSAREIRDDLWNLIPKAERLTSLKPPADEPASNGYNALLASNGGKPGAFDYGLGHIKLEHQYVVELIGRLEDALHLTHSSDQSATGDIQKTAGNGGVLG